MDNHNTPLESAAVLDYGQAAEDTLLSRAALQLHHDKIDEFGKWADGVVRFLRGILEAAASTR